MINQNEQTISIRKPPWLKRKLPSGPMYERTRSLINTKALHTVCQEAKCPNQFECFSKLTATFLILGDRCTRNCRFCNIEAGPGGPPDLREPERVAEAARKMNLQYVVITSVTRDDLPDGGAGIFAETIHLVHKNNSGVKAEVLIPDFQGELAALKTVLKAAPDVLNHNIETVPRLYPAVRPEALYQRSLELLRRAKAYSPTMIIKSGLMLGLGENSGEIRKTLQDILETGCGILTLGQYLQPSKHHLPVARFATPEEFDSWREEALQMGFAEVASGPFVRSSYQARELYRTLSP